MTRLRHLGEFRLHNGSEKWDPLEKKSVPAYCTSFPDGDHLGMATTCRDLDLQLLDHDWAYLPGAMVNHDSIKALGLERIDRDLLLLFFDSLGYPVFLPERPTTFQTAGQTWITYQSLPD